MVPSAIVERVRLRGRLERLAPAIVTLTAPAGYGKTALIHSLFGADPGTRVCDCDGLRDDLDLARRLIPEIDDHLSDGSRSVAERVAFALDYISENPSERIVFDRARFIGERPESLEFLMRILERRPAGTTVVLSARETVPLRLTRFAAPHEIVVLRAADLAFDRDEQRALFAPYVTDAAALERISRISEGWPIAVFLLQRFAREERLDKLLHRLDDVAFGELHDYLVDEVLSLYDSPTLHALFACAAMPHATDADVRDAFPEALSGNALAEFAKESPFLRRDAEGRYRVHPLVAAAVLEHQEERKRLVVAQLSLSREAEGDYLRATELYIANRDCDAAAAALARFDVLPMARPPQRYLRLLKRFNPSQILRYPHLFGVHALMRMFREPPQALFDEAESLWRTISPKAEMRERYGLFVLRVHLLAYLGEHERARAEVQDVIGRVEGSSFETPLLALRAFLRARSGELIAASADIDRALPGTLEGDALAAALYVTLAAEVTRVHGDRMEMQFLERALVRARESGVENAQALVVAHMLVAAWLCGNDARARSAAEELDAFAADGIMGFAYLCGAMLQRDVAPAPCDLPEFVIYGQLIELGNSLDERRRLELAQAAFERAARLGHAFLYVLVSVALAIVDEPAFDEHAAAASYRAAAMDSDALRGAVASFVERRTDCGMLSPFVTRLSRGGKDVAPPIEISFATGHVRVDGVSIAIVGRELELLLAIALRREPSSRARLASLLWPDLDDSGGRNVFSVCLHRLRARLPRRDVIERDGDGYRLHARAFVDLWELDRAFGTARKKGSLNERERAHLERIWETINADASIRTDQWEWFEPAAQRLRDARVELAHVLGDDALAREDAAIALQYAKAALEADRCDERAVEIGIRAHLIDADRAAAMRLFRQYRTALAAELGAEPSASLSNLVKTA
ncbi:MAG: hypothetical protein JO322_02580 [Candidatus Eremiobacteraeota bacterium]|nr:hypothetical protein [Candidatus Eremiobacteraeota bacterium]